MANNENLKPAKKGEVRNPKGRPKGAKGVETLLRQAMKAIVDDEDFEKLGIDPKSKFDPRLIILGQWAKNMCSDDAKVSESTAAGDKLYERMDGKAVAKVEQTVNDVTPPTKIELTAPDDDSKA
jgi:hypothetical protein